MIGGLERNNIDVIFYLLPIDMSDPPGEFTPVFWESSTYIISLASYPSDKYLDISSSLLNFDYNIIILFILFFILLSLLTFKILKLFSTIFEALFTFFCLTLKQDSSVSIKKKFRLVLLCIVFYHFFLIILFESSVNSNLVVKSRKNLINNVDNLYEKKNYLPFFFKGHFILNYFSNPYSNQKIKKIFQRVSNCSNCIQTMDEHITQSILYKNFSFEKKAFIFDRTVKNVLKNLYCTGNHEKINSLGYFHTSLPIFKNYFAFLMSRKLDSKLKQVLSKRVTALRENNLSEQIFNSIDEISMINLKESSVSFKKCFNENYFIKIKDDYKNIKLINIFHLLSAIFIFFSFFTLFFFIQIFFK